MPVLMEVLVPENSNLYITTNFEESEVILERNSKFKILDISIENKIWSEYDDYKKNKIVMKILKTE